MKRFLLVLFVLLPALALADYVPAVHRSGKWGFKESKYSDKFIIKPKFEKVNEFTGKYAFVCQKGLWGIIGKDGKFVVVPKYSSASKPYNGITIVQLGSKYGLFKDCKDILRIEYESIERLKTGAFRLKKDGRVGLADASGKIFLPVEYQDIVIYNNGYKLKANNLFGLADTNGKIIVETKYKDVLYLQSNTFAVYSTKFEFVNSEGKVVEQPNNVLLYTSTDGKIVERSIDSDNNQYYWQVNVVSNTCQNGQGIMVFDKPITSIGNSAFSCCSGLISVTIPNSVTEIGYEAFCYCVGLTSITIPNSVTAIGEDAFCGCDGLTSITIPDSVTSIRERAFYDCDALISITVPDSVTAIGYAAFSGCYRLTRVDVNISDLARYCTSNPMHSIPGEKHLYLNGKEITSLVIPNSVTSIGEEAFDNCRSLTSVTIPDSVTSIGSWAFASCGGGLTRVNVNISDLARYCTSNPMGSIPGEKHLYLNGKEIINLVIPNSVTSIGDWAFEDCTSLTSVTIGNSVTSIGYGAFWDCSGLTSITIGNSVTKIGKSAFCDCDGLTSITIPDSVTTIGYEAFKGCYRLTRVNVHISDLAKYCTSNPMWEIPGAKHLYLNGTEIANLVIPNSVTLIGIGALSDCDGLTNITIPNSVIWIGDSAFFRCDGLTSITIPNSVTWIGKGAFADCSSLKEFKGKYASPDGRCLIVDGVLNSFTPGGLTKYAIPNSVTKIGDYVFAWCSGLKSITIPNSVTSIGEGVFVDCDGLTSITIPNSVTKIGDYAFALCDGLTSITIPNSVTKIGDYAFCSCDRLTSITIPNGVTSIGKEAFCGCNRLTSITIPNSVTSIGYKAFYGCVSLEAVYINATIPPYLDKEVFDYDAGRICCPIYVPSSSLSRYKGVGGNWRRYSSYIRGR